MTTSAIITMLLVQVSVTIITGYFLVKVLRTPPKPEDGDSFGQET